MSSIVKVDKSQGLPVQHTLRFKFAITITLLVATLLVVNAAILTFSRANELEIQIEQSGMNFAQLTPTTLGQAYQKYGPTEVYKFRADVESLIHRNSHIEQITLLDPQGHLLFDSADPSFDSAFKSPQGTGVRMPIEILEAINNVAHLPNLDNLPKRKTKNQKHEPVLEIIAPYIDASGTVPLELRYIISLRSLRNQTFSAALQTGGLTLISLLLSIAVAVLFARRITKPLHKLTLGTSAIATGDFDHKLNIHTNDELQDLARNFNFMAEKLKDNITKLEDSKLRLSESNVRLEQSNARLAQANEELKEIDRLKSEFLQTMSHELRTPLSAIKGYNEYLLEQTVGQINASQERALRTIQRNIDRLTTYINALLDFSRMEADAIPINIRPFHLPLILEQVIASYRSQIEKKRLKLVRELEDNLPAVMGDCDRIAQVFDNLISNAIKFTSEDGKIMISARCTDKGKKFVEITVTDTGIGIAEQHLDKIFDRFYQVDSSTTRKYGGIGIGLSLVKSIIDAHKTSITVRSQQRFGTAFSFMLEQAEESELIETDAQLAVIAHKKSYLIELIDSEPDINEVVKIFLVKDGYNVIDAVTGEEGFLIACKNRPDLIILGDRLPDINSHKMLARLKQDTHTQTIPVIILSAAKNDVESALPDAADQLAKPVDFNQLKVKIHQYLQQGNTTNDRPTVMIVDDEPDAVQLLRDGLSREGFNTLAAFNGHGAFNLLKREGPRPVLILLDIIMPELSGWDVLTTLKADPTTAPIPVILVSAKGGEEDIKRGYELGARDYFIKPVEIKNLLTEIKNVIQEQNQTDFFM
ncbi:MAG: response regulator [Acidobacteriota bacterium]